MCVCVCVCVKHYHMPIPVGKDEVVLAKKDAASDWYICNVGRLITGSVISSGFLKGTSW